MLGGIVVDALPARLWSAGNLWSMPLVGEWHFCVGAHPSLGHPVRTIERNGVEIAHGRRLTTDGTHGVG